MSIRLTKQMREDILQKMLSHRFAAEEEKICLEYEKLGKKVYSALMG